MLPSRCYGDIVLDLTVTRLHGLWPHETMVKNHEEHLSMTIKEYNIIVEPYGKKFNNFTED